MPKISELVEKTNLIGSEFVAIQDANVTKKTSLASIGSILGGGGASVTVSDTAPVAENEGDLWYTPTDGALYVWITGSLNAWVQTNGGGGGGGASVTVSDTAPADAGEGDLWFDDVNATLYVYLAGSTNAWIQISGGGQSGGGSGGASVDFHSGTFHGEDAGVPEHEIIIPVDPSGKCGGVLELSDNATTSDQDEGGMMSWNFDASTGQIKMQQSWSGGEGFYNKSASVTETLTSTYQTIAILTSYQLAVWQAKYVDGNLYLTSDAHHGVWQAATSIPGSSGGGSGGGASVTVSETAPTAPGDGDLWFDTSVMELYVYVAAESSWIQTNGGGGSGGSFSTGWVNQDKNGVAVNVNTRLEFDHNLGTTDFVVKVYQANDANGTDAREVSDYYWNANNEYGSRVHDITSTSLAIEFGAGGDYNLNLAAVGSDTTSSLAGNWIKVVCVAGGGGSGGNGPRAYVAFDGTQSATTNPTIYNSYNVTSITDKSTTGGGITWRVNFSTPITNPIVQFSIDSQYSANNYNAVHHGYHIIDNDTIEFNIWNYSGGGQPDSSFNHWSVLIF